MPLESTKRNGDYIQETRQQKIHIRTDKHTGTKTHILTDYTQTETKHTNLVYTDETWVNTHHNNEYIWVDSDRSGGWKVPSRGDNTYNDTRQRRGQ